LHLCDIEMVMGLIGLSHYWRQFMWSLSLPKIETCMYMILPLLLIFVVLNYIMWIWTWKRNMKRNTSRHSWTCMNVLMTNCWLVCGLILQQTFNLWFFISWANITNCIKSALSLGSCSSKQCKVIR
jgi:hypothetical protein